MKAQRLSRGFAVPKGETSRRITAGDHSRPFQGNSELASRQLNLEFVLLWRSSVSGDDPQPNSRVPFEFETATRPDLIDQGGVAVQCRTSVGGGTSSFFF